MPDEVRAPCGILCSAETCEVFKATVTDDNELRQKCLPKWQEIAREHWRTEIELEDIYCRGCILTDDATFAPCHCPIAACAKEKGYASCAQCPEWKTCDWLTMLHKDCSEAREYLLSQE